MHIGQNQKSGLLSWRIFFLPNPLRSRDGSRSQRSAQQSGTQISTVNCHEASLKNDVLLPLFFVVTTVQPLGANESELGDVRQGKRA